MYYALPKDMTINDKNDMYGVCNFSLCCDFGCQLLKCTSNFHDIITDVSIRQKQFLKIVFRKFYRKNFFEPKISQEAKIISNPKSLPRAVKRPLTGVTLAMQPIQSSTPLKCDHFIIKHVGIT